MYNRDHGKGFVKALTVGARKHYKRAFSKVRRQSDKREEKRSE